MNLGLKSKRIIVTGAASGVGKEIVLGLINEEAHPICIDVKEYNTSQLKSYLSSKGIPFNENSYHVCDISQPDELSKVVSSIEDVHGLVNNAAMLGDDLDEGRNIIAWDKRINVNARAGFHLIELLEPKMREGGGGHC